MTLILVACAFMQFGFAQTSRKITDERPNECYKSHPFLLDALMQISDKDFADTKKSQLRRKAIRIQFAKKPKEIRACVDDIIQYAKDQGDEENLKYVILRTGEVSSIVYQNQVSPPIPEAIR